MSDIVLMQAALFQLRAAVESIGDDFLKTQVRLATGILGQAIEGAAEGINSSVASNIEFALNDVVAAAADLAQEDAALIEGPLNMLQVDVAKLVAQTQLPEAVVAKIRALQTKLRERKKAIERQTYVEGGGAPLPHDPEELAREAGPIRHDLANHGFATPALDAFITDPASLRFHSIIEVLDELEVIAG